MKILHTSDWHIGRMLYGRKRYDEFSAFFTWLLATLNNEQIDVLLVAGDIFDTTTPSHRAQQLYYQFLCQVARSTCRHVVIIAGNHDSPSFLHAPKDILTVLNVHVVAHARDNDAEQVIVLTNQHQEPELIVCAIPYLRDSDMRTASSGETLADKEQKLLAGIAAHYARIVALAHVKKAQLAVDIPIVAMGHLFTTGGQTVDGDGVRELYVGSLAHVGAGIFPAGIDYLALGHLHVAQTVMHSEFMRYSGSPIAMGFGEAQHRKSVCIIELPHNTIHQLAVPVFQELVRIQGDTATILATLEQLKQRNSHAWLELIYEGDDSIASIGDALDQALVDSQLVILRIKNPRLINQALTRLHPEETLVDLSHHDVFERCLIAHDISDEQCVPLRQLYADVIKSLVEHDHHAF